MKPAKIAKPMFRTPFAGTANDVIRLLDYLRFLHAEDASAQLAGHELGPSELWRGWSDDTFIGFSGDRLLLMSGHRFGWSELLPRPFRWPWQPKSDFSAKRESETFARNYPDFAMPGQHVPLWDYHPGAYLRFAEAYILSGKPKVGRMLEIGAGNCVHVAFRHLLQPEIRTVVIDLPASIPVGFLLLRLVGIDVALPNENIDAAVRFQLPHQSIGEGFDFAFNMSSFQEMTQKTVNGYLKLISGALDSGGTLQHVNMLEARHIPDNRVANYNMTGMILQSQMETLYHSAVAGFPVVNVLACKRTDRTE